jgi:hypothetical protein
VETDDGDFFFEGRSYSIEEILLTFRRAGWTVIYPTEEVHELQAFRLNEGTYSVHQILHKVLKGTDLIGQICLSNEIQVFKRPIGTIKIVGTIVNTKTGRGIPGVQVTTLRHCGTFTDENGHYEINAPNDEVIHYVYFPWEKFFTSQVAGSCHGDSTVINVKMNVDVPGDRNIYFDCPKL